MIKDTSRVRLSASRIKTYENCSLLYAYKYKEKIPDESNTGAKIGSITHSVFELLLNPRHRDIYNSVLSLGVRSNKSLLKFCNKKLEELNIAGDENFDLLSGFVELGLSLDFLSAGGELLPPELEFDEDFGAFRVYGLIDRVTIYKDKGIVKIQDYKTSKKKFSADDTESNLQAMIYSLVARRKWPDLKPSLEFIFLRFPKDPYIKLEFSDSELGGLKYYLSDMSEKLSKFDIKKDKLSNPAANKSGLEWMCRAGKTWRCPYYSRFDYYVLLDKDGKIVLSSKELKVAEKSKKEDQRIEKRTHNGCEAHAREKIDWFD